MSKHVFVTDLLSAKFVRVLAAASLILTIGLSAGALGQQPVQDPSADDVVPEPPGEDGEPELLPENAHYYAPRPDMFYNYYAQPTGGGQPAAMYMAPRPVPPTVGHTYYTYQPFYPHEYMYPHYREYYRTYGNYHHYGPCVGTPSVNKTTVRYQRGGIRSLYYKPFNNLVIPNIPCGDCGNGRCGIGGTIGCLIHGRRGCVSANGANGGCTNGNCAGGDCDQATPPATQPTPVPTVPNEELTTPVGYQRYYQR